MKRLIKTIRETIRAYTLIEFEREMAVDEMRDYFATESVHPEKAAKSEEDDPSTLRYEVEPRRPSRLLKKGLAAWTRS